MPLEPELWRAYRGRAVHPDLRVHDNPALAATVAAAERVVPLYVLDPAIKAAANRHQFLAESLADLRDNLRRLGGDLVIRTGDPVRQAVAVAREVSAEGIALAGEFSRYARARRRPARRDLAALTTRSGRSGSRRPPGRP